jgi:hypothetical protein
MATAQEYRDQLHLLRERVTEGVAAFVRQGHVTRDQADAFLTRVGLALPEDDETRAARLELEEFQTLVRNAINDTVSSELHRSEALRRFGIAA